MFKVIRSNTEIAIIPPTIAPFRSNVLQSLTTAQSMHYICPKSKVKDQGHRVRCQGHGILL